ncbi:MULTISPECIES: serine--tRNA ligase [Methylobacterium]|uniref:Serine--tRNA ligase n=1 Tax=Methylobacterium longum TaxID=767694 RepID=A0ABT8AKM7_9HYPH|nr:MULTISPECIES: serine--tRNA ligase [Methylobacterium]MCJ2098528.1 serine--tRNA ligase [Methylobacterium sp. E-046]MDN3570334.1 serine--tRNA ligase [Methylobacterium longum]GJE11331.1 Serine--tRNA ligase [Methylobacterium longum]
MHDIRAIRDNPDAFDRDLARRGLAPLSAELIALDEARKSSVSAAQANQERRNALAKEVGGAKKAKDEARAAALMVEVAALKGAEPELKAAQEMADRALADRLAAIPNRPKADVPEGADEHGNVLYRSHAATRERLNAGKEHFELGEAAGLMDFEAAAKLSGSRFVVLKGQLARLERALGQFMLDLHTQEHGYLEVAPPILVRDAAMFGTAQLPKFEDDQFSVFKGLDAVKALETATDPAPANAEKFWLVPTAEVPLTNLVREAILREEELPLRFTALTPCFRAEAGAAGRDTRGMLRQHQFNKVELVSITTPQESANEHERMLTCAEAVLKKLDLPYRVMTLCTGDMGFASQKTYDIEVWVPGQRTHREISSCSVCGDFQARRMNARYRGKDGKPAYVHTLNGSGVAVGRALIAVMENYQNPDGSITVPSVLHPYMGGLNRIEGTR